MSPRDLADVAMMAAHETRTKYALPEYAAVEICKDRSGWYVAQHWLSSRWTPPSLSVRHRPALGTIPEVCATVYADTEAAVRDWLTASGQYALLDAVETEERWTALFLVDTYETTGLRAQKAAGG
jgi:hypothetical protein